ncbi:putative DD41D transposase [Trichonephila clavipes]|nr:putative DD41D transposase [Trichonephila clavipes]
MRDKEDLKIRDLLMQKLEEKYLDQRESMRQDAKQNILKIKAENKKTYNMKRKKALEYQVGDLVVVQRTQFGGGLKLRSKFFGPYQITEAKPTDRYTVEKFGLAIHQNDHLARRRFLIWAQNEIAIVPDFHRRILFSDEALFWLNGYVNKQNCRIWNEANPQVYVETPLHPEKLTVWCALWAGGIIGPYFFKNVEGHNVTVNGDRYRNMITNFFIPELNNHNVQELWFQQDGAIYHTARATIDLLKDTFGDRLISRFGPVNWPPRSCDLTALDNFLWGYVKSFVYADKSQTLDQLKDNIRRVIPIYGHKCWTATAGSDVVQSGRPIFDEFFQHLWPYIGNNTANVVFQMVKRLWLIRIDQ